MYPSWFHPRPSPVASDLRVGCGHAGEDDPLAFLHRLGLDGEGDRGGICQGETETAVTGTTHGKETEAGTKKAPRVEPGAGSCLFCQPSEPRGGFSLAGAGVFKSTLGGAPGEAQWKTKGWTVCGSASSGQCHMAGGTPRPSCLSGPVRAAIPHSSHWGSVLGRRHSGEILSGQRCSPARQASAIPRPRSAGGRQRLAQADQQQTWRPPSPESRSCAPSTGPHALAPGSSAGCLCLSGRVASRPGTPVACSCPATLVGPGAVTAHRGAGRGA